jgi:hypothetical protein
VRRAIITLVLLLVSLGAARADLRNQSLGRSHPKSFSELLARLVSWPLRPDP